MSLIDKAKDLFTDVDANRDGKVDKEEFRNWLTKPRDGIETSDAIYRNDRLRSGSQTDDRIPSYSTHDAINSSGPDETTRYLDTTPNIFRDPHPRIIRRSTTERPVTCEQRVRVRYLQPPPLPPPEPLIVKEIRPDQPPPPPPLVIRETTGRTTTPPPLILRERPPVAPARIRGETVTRYLPALPVPPRSVIIERYQNNVEKPRDIVIERWLPYGPQPERQTIVQRAPAPKGYEQPYNTIIIHDNVQVRVARKFERLGISQEDPETYLSRYGTSLLDSATLLQEARNAGINEDLSLPPTANVVTHPPKGTYDFDRQGESYASSGCASSSYPSGQRYTTGTDVTYSGTRVCPLCGSPLSSNTVLAGNVEPSYCSTSHPADININITEKRTNEHFYDKDRHQYI